MSPLAIDVQLVAAGVGIHLAVTRLGSWLRRRHEAWPAWFGLSAAGMAVVLIGNVLVLRQPDEVTLFVRSAALSLVMVSLLGSFAAFTGERMPRHLQRVLLAIVVGRMLLWVTTDLVFAHQVIDGIPRYGPLVSWTAVPALVLLLGETTLLAGRVSQPFERAALLAGSGIGLVLATATLVVGDPRVAELLTGCWTIPELVVLQLVIVRRRAGEVDREARVHAGQAAIARLGERALAERSVEVLLGHVATLVEEVVGLPCTVELDAAPSGRLAQSRWSEPIVGHRGTVGQIHLGEQDEVDEEHRHFLATVAHLVGAWVDRAEVAAAAERRAEHDDLTGLPNRVRLRRRLAEAVQAGPASGAGLAVVFLDLDGFKDVNDALGHAAGDCVLKEVAARLDAAAGQIGTVCRFGGDEFVVVLEGLPDDASAAKAAEDIQAVVGGPIGCAGTVVSVSASVGVVTWRGGDTAESLFRDADTAMYRAKERGRGSVVVFDPALRRELLQRLETQSALGRAAAAGEIEVHYQPVVDLRTSETIGVEALARWRRDGELISPLEWIPTAEATGAIVSIGRAVLRQACRDALRLPAHVGVAVNVSAGQLAPGFAAVVDDALSCGLDPGRLTLEITESALVDDAAMVSDLLCSLRRRGVRIAIDDFGTGFSSLGQVSTLPIDVLKIDRCFVDRLLSVDGHAIASTIVALADALDLEVVAEGVESAEQVDLLRQLGCRWGQGFHFARPGPLSDHLRARTVVASR